MTRSLRTGADGVARSASPPLRGGECVAAIFKCTKIFRMRFKALAAAIIVSVFGTPAHAEAPVTFNNQVVRIFQQHCQTCHRPGNIAPFSLLTYADTRPWARAIRDAVLLKKMPPWKPVGSHGVFEGERSLTEQEIQTISQWVNDGAREGDAG